MSNNITFQVTSDSLLQHIAGFIKASGRLPVGVSDIRLRDWGGVQDPLHVVIDASDPVEHDVLLGVEMIEGEVTLNVSPDDVTGEQERRWMIGEIADVMRNGFTQLNGAVFEFKDWLDSIDAELRVFEFRVDGAAWDNVERRLHGRVTWHAWACQPQDGE